MLFSFIGTRHPSREYDAERSNVSLRDRVPTIDMQPDLLLLSLPHDPSLHVFARWRLISERIQVTFFFSLSLLPQPPFNE